MNKRKQRSKDLSFKVGRGFHTVFKETAAGTGRSMRLLLESSFELYQVMLHPCLRVGEPSELEALDKWLVELTEFSDRRDVGTADGLAASLLAEHLRGLVLLRRYHVLCMRESAGGPLLAAIGENRDLARSLEDAFLSLPVHAKRSSLSRNHEDGGSR